MSDEMQSNGKKEIGVGGMLFKSLFCVEEKWKGCKSKFPQEKWKKHRYWIYPLRMIVALPRIAFVDVPYEVFLGKK